MKTNANEDYRKENSFAAKLFRHCGNPCESFSKPTARTTIRLGYTSLRWITKGFYVST